METMETMDNWYKSLQEIDKTTPVVGVAVAGQLFSTLEEAKSLLDEDFDSGFGGEDGEPFTAWTDQKVYFPACYDGSEWMACVNRHPCNVATNHVGGG